MTPEQHLAHLKRLIQPPYTNGWWAYAKARAEELAMEDGQNAALPALLKAEHDRIAEAAKGSRPQPNTGSNSKRTGRREIVSRETMHADGPSTAPKASTSQPVSSLQEGA